MTRIAPTPARPTCAGEYTPTTPVPQVHSSPVPEGARGKSLLSSKPVLWFLFLFNLAVAVAAVAVGNHLHIHGHTIHGAQVAVGMGAVALGAAAALFSRREQRA